MSSNSKIEWTETTWNPVTGCTKNSDGCKNCYAYRMTKRLKAMGQEKYKNEFKVTTHDYTVERPIDWKKPKCIFVNSMSDLFHKEVPLTFIKRVFNTMNQADWHIFQVLTKRSNRLLELNEQLPWAKNIWQGVSVENNKYISRIDDLSKTDAKTKFISFEPLIGEIDVKSIDLSNIDWVIVGGESGPGSRPIKKEWVLNIRNKCIKEDIPFFFKQWGGFNKKENGRELEGELWSEYPKAINSLN
ncbi:MAG: hypothetical protein BHK79_02860 [Halanaerobium sp. MDAL1]|nr:MAG: hypothetical protein BHK79_02860 [Halanaerobium sp. MDAL1]